MRPAWHFVAPSDIRWIQGLTSAGVRRRVLPYNRQLEFDTPTQMRALRVIERALRDRQFLTNTHPFRNCQ
jgi:hypothetical protein